jgi:hypothetical protein
MGLGYYPHDSRNKKEGKCPLDMETYCTDITGSHHSYIESGNSKQNIYNIAKAKHGHVTRIEVIEE